MNTNTAIGVVVGMVVVLGGGYYLMNQNSTPTDMSAIGAQEETGETAQAGTVKGSFASLATRGGSWKCTVDTSTAQSVSSGVTYVSGGKVRADFTTSVQGYGAVESHMIADGEDVYTWSSMMPQGIKSKMTMQGTGGAETSGQGMNANMEYSYDCQPWSADSAMFAVPADITFRSY